LPDGFEKPSDREAHPPIPDRANDHRAARPFESTQRTHRDVLGAVGELECRRDEQEMVAPEIVVKPMGIAGLSGVKMGSHECPCFP